MHRTPSKRKQITQRVIVYSAMTVAVVLLVTVMIGLMLGYRLNRTSNSVQQGGLIQFSSTPGGAKVTLGSAKLSGRTPSKITAYEGRYTVKMERDGYAAWQKKVRIVPGSVLWLNYTKLLPETIDTDAVLTLPRLAQAVASPNGRYMATREAESGALRVLDMRRDTPEEVALALPEAITVQSGATDRIAQWSEDNEAMLVQRTLDDNTEWLVVDIKSPEDSYNVTQTYDIEATEMRFGPGSHNRVYVQTIDGSVRRIDASAKALSPVLARNVDSWSFIDKDALMYSYSDAKQTHVAYVSLDSEASRKIVSLDGVKSVYAAHGEYFGDNYVAIATEAPRSMTLYKVRELGSSDIADPVESRIVHTSQLTYMPTRVDIRTGGRFVIIQGARAVGLYDIELDTFSLTSAAAPIAPELKWLDRYHFYTVNSRNKLVSREFDGANAREIATVQPGLESVQSDNGEYIYSFIQDNDTTKLQRSLTILP